MLLRQKLVSFGIPTAGAATIVVAALLSPWVGQGTTHERRPATIAIHPPESTAHGRYVDVVFAVDTTASMSNLIEGAKRTVWSIATHIKKTEPEAQLRFGLVAYRDSDSFTEYVTRELPLTSDLDAVFAELSSYRARGGGDLPEHVAAALDASIHKMQWHPSAKKIVFVVGDAPPAPRPDAPSYDELARVAAGKQITINTIRAGHMEETAAAFQLLASIGGGEFSTIAQDGGVQIVDTPYDGKLAELSGRIDRGAIIAGDEGVRARYEAGIAAAAAAPTPAAADRASYYSAVGGAGRDKHDIVGSYADGTLDPSVVEPTTLPADLQGLDKDALRAELHKRAGERRKVQVEITELVKKRDQFLQEEAARRGPSGGFDATVKSTIEKQLAE